MNLVRNRDGSWAVVTDDGVALVSGLPTVAAVRRWVERQYLWDVPAVWQRVEAALADA